MGGGQVGFDRKLVGFELIDKGIPRKDYEIYDSDNSNIGVVTSGTMSPSLGKAIGLGYVSANSAKTGTIIYINIRNNMIKAVVSKTPFK